MVKGISILVMAMLLAFSLTGFLLARLALPRLDGLVNIPELKGRAIVRFDARSIPYVEAESEADLFFVQGWQTARDRFFQMDMLRRQAQGELSEVFGPSTLVADKLMHTIGIKRISEVEMSQLSTKAKLALEAYCLGVNSYLKSNLNNLPLEFFLLGYKPKPWQPKDSLSILKYLSYTLDESWQLDELRQRIANKIDKNCYERLFNEHSPPATPLSYYPSLKEPKEREDKLLHLAKVNHLLGPATSTFGSSAFAVSAKQSDTGAGLLAADKHTTFSVPDLYYLCSLTTPDIHVAGATIPGAPGIFIGRNQYMTWTTANLKADVQDLFLEEFSPRITNEYRTPTGWEAATETNEIIPVRFAKDLVHKVILTRHGPVLLKTNNTAVSLSWTGTQGHSPILNTMLELNKAQTWAEFKAILNDYHGPPQVFVFADRIGNVAYQAAGLIPMRTAKGQGEVIMPGWEKGGQWVSYIPFAQLPSALNPASGYIVAANQCPISQSYPWLLGHQWAAPYRASRIASVLSSFQSSGRKIGLPDVNELQSDQYAHLGSMVTKELKQAIQNTELIDKVALSAVDVFEHWDGNLKADYSASTIYESFLCTLAKRLLETKLDRELSEEYLKRWAMWPTLLENFMNDKPADWLPHEERTYTTFLLTTFSQSLKKLRLFFGCDDPTKWLWQSSHKATFNHWLTRPLPWLSLVFNVGPIGVGGDQDTVNCMDIVTDKDDGSFPAQSGPTLRMLVDMADQDKFYLTSSLGQSGQLFSPYRLDQLKAWQRADSLPFFFSNTLIEQKSQHKLVLTNNLEDSYPTSTR